MNELKSSTLFQRMDEAELSLCLLFNRAGHRRWLQRFFASISRLGDGVFWYTLMVLIPFIYGLEAITTSVHMGVVALVALLLYKWLKGTMVRQRPFILHKEIQNGTAPLDLYSFPSGHTLHAVAFTVVALSYHPELIFILLPFTLLVAMSRVILGLHYPTDVLAGATIGGLLSFISLQLF